MNKTRLIPFDAEKAKKGAKVVTRCGYPVRIGFYDIKGTSFPILGAVTEEDNTEIVRTFTKDGCYTSLDVKNDYDLFIEEEETRRTYSGTDSIFIPKDDEGIKEELIDAINGLWDNDALPMPLSVKRKEAWLAWLEKQGEKETLCDKCKKSQSSHSCQDITALGMCAVEHEQKHSDKKELHEIETVKIRRMTNQELSWWLRDCPEEYREVCRVDEDTVYCRYIYLKCDANDEVPEYVRIRRNGGEWQEPIIQD